MREAARPIVRLDEELFGKYAAEKAIYDELSKEDRKTAQVPKQVRLRIEDTTIEAIQEVLKDSPEGVMLLQDELSGFFGGMDKYASGRGAAKDRGFWLQAYNGGGYAVNRIGRGAAVIANAGVSLLGGIQPEPLRKLSDDAVDDGLIQRLIPIVLQPATESIDEDPAGAVGRYETLINWLRNHTSSTPLTITFDDGAQGIRRRLERKHLTLMKWSEAINRKLAAHIGKYDGIFVRLCLTWHCIEHVQQGMINPVSEDTAQRVERFLHEFLFPHATSFYFGLLGLADDHDRLTAVADYILAHKTTTITNRIVATSVRSMRKLSKPETNAIFEQLEALGWLIQRPSLRLGAPPHWLVNPRVHQKFAQRAAQEAQRRAEIREEIADTVEAIRKARTSS